MVCKNTPHALGYLTFLPNLHPYRTAIRLQKSPGNAPYVMLYDGSRDGSHIIEKVKVAYLFLFSSTQSAYECSYSCSSHRTCHHLTSRAQVSMEMSDRMAEIVVGLIVHIIPIPVTSSQITPSAIHITYTSMPTR